MYTVDYFIEKFSKIPESLWICGDQGTMDGPRCALGHCHTSKRLGTYGICGNEHPEGIALMKIFLDNGLTTKDSNAYAKTIEPGRYHVIASVNNGSQPRYQQPTAKQRILAALYDIKKSQQTLYEDITKELAVLPVEEKADQPVKEIV